MTEYVGYSREWFEEGNVQLIPEDIVEEIRLKIASIFGNAKHDIVRFIRKNPHTGKSYESMLQYAVYVEALTPQMIELMNDWSNHGMHIDTIHGHNVTDDGKKIRLYVRINDFFAKIITSRDGTGPYDPRIQQTFEQPWERELVR